MLFFKYCFIDIVLSLDVGHNRCGGGGGFIERPGSNLTNVRKVMFSLHVYYLISGRIAIYENQYPGPFIVVRIS